MEIAKNILKTMQYTMRQVLGTGRRNVFYLLLDVARRVAVSLWLIVLPQKIVSSMLSEQYRQGVKQILFLCVLIFANDLAGACMSRMRNKMQVNINIDLNTRLSRSIMGTEYEKVETKSYLEKVDFARRSLERNSVLAVYDRLIEVLSGVTSLAGIVYIISSLPPVLTALILFTVAVGAAGDIYRMNYAFDRDRQGNEIERNLYYARNDLAGNRYAKDIRVWNLYQYISGKVELYAKKLCDLWAKTSLKSVKVVGWTYIVNGLQYVIVYTALAWMVYEGMLDVGSFILYTSATIAFGDTAKNVLGALLAMGAEYRYIDAAASVTEAQGESRGGQGEFHFNAKIELKDVWYRYQGSEAYIFQGLNLVIEKNKSYAFVGRNGAGKTTLVKLILGLYRPEKGSIFVDGISLSQLDPDRYRELFSCVFQDYHIYGFSIQENISFGAGERHRTHEVIEKAGIKKKIESLSEGLDTYLNREINENAVMFSGGQEQQLATARALYKDSEIYILDEPTAALSPNSEYALYQQFHRISRNKTVIFISHRLASCTLCDEVVVLDEGKIVEKGRHSDLIQKSGLYAEMFEKQASLYQDEIQET